MNTLKSGRKRASAKNIIIETLSSAGWKKTRKCEVFDLAELTYTTNQMHLEVEEGDRKGSFYLKLADHAGKEVVLVIQFQKKLEKVLEIIKNFQDQITPLNFREHVRTIVQLGVPIFVDTGEEVVPLEDDEGSETEPVLS